MREEARAHRLGDGSRRSDLAGLARRERPQFISTCNPSSWSVGAPERGKSALYRRLDGHDGGQPLPLPTNPAGPSPTVGAPNARHPGIARWRWRTAAIEQQAIAALEHVGSVALPFRCERGVRDAPEEQLHSEKSRPCFRHALEVITSKATLKPPPATGRVKARAGVA